MFCEKTSIIKRNRPQWTKWACRLLFASKLWVWGQEMVSKLIKLSPAWNSEDHCSNYADNCAKLQANKQKFKLVTVLILCVFIVLNTEIQHSLTEWMVSVYKKIQAVKCANKRFITAAFTILKMHRRHARFGEKGQYKTELCSCKFLYICGTLNLENFIYLFYQAYSTLKDWCFFLFVL